MRITKIELKGDGGTMNIERENNVIEIRIDSVVRNPKRGEQAWKTWTIPASTTREAMFEIATEVQQRTDGQRGTNSVVNDYLNELMRFTD